MERIFHNHTKWEEVELGFFSTAPKNKMEQYAEKVISVLANKKECEKRMRDVISSWPNSCEHNLSNSALNRVAWLGQSACCLAHSIPQDATMKIWSLLSDMEKEEANKIAKKIIKEWDSKHEN